MEDEVLFRCSITRESISPLFNLKKRLKFFMQLKKSPQHNPFFHSEEY